MNTPNAALMRHFGTDRVYFAKTAATPMGLRALRGVAAAEQQAGVEDDLREAQMVARLRAAALRAIEAKYLRDATERARHARMPVLLAGGPGFRADELSDDLGLPMYAPRGPSQIRGSEMPAGFDEGMVRLASIAKEAGQEMAKQALADVPSMASKLWSHTGLGKSPGKKLLGLGLGVGTMYGGYKALKGGLNWLGGESAERSYNRNGYQLAHGVNEYNQPQRGTPLVT